MRSKRIYIYNAIWYHFCAFDRNWNMLYYLFEKIKLFTY